VRLPDLGSIHEQHAIFEFDLFAWQADYTFDDPVPRAARIF